MALETAYRLTRRKGRRVTVCEVTGSTVDPTTGRRSVAMNTHNVAKVVVEPTAYSRIVRAQAAQQDWGPTTFIFWTRDITFRRLTVDSYFAVDGAKYQVVASSVEDDGLIVMTKELVGDVPQPVVTANVTNSLGLSGDVVQE